MFPLEKSNSTTINIFHTEQHGRHNTCNTPMTASGHGAMINCFSLGWYLIYIHVEHILLFNI